MQIFDRRHEKSRSALLGQPLFMQVSKTAAASVLAGCTLLALAGSYVTTAEIKYGPLFLIICALGAWLVGNRYAVLLALYVVVIQLLNGHAATIDDTPIMTLLDLALRLCSALAVVLMLGVARSALEIEWRLARIDPLTGALNRKAFFEAVQSKKSPTGISVLVFADVDGLKGLNDQHGHQAGDDALQRFAGRVKKAIRKDDLFARMGGDEFVIFLKVRDQSAANLVAQRLNRILNVNLPEHETNLKCSLGVLVLPVGSKSIDAEIRQADTLMYHAKRERVGLIMAISVAGGMKKVMPFALNTDPIGHQTAKLGPIDLRSEIVTSDGFSEHVSAA